MSIAEAPVQRVHDELDVLSDLLQLSDLAVIELGCGAAALARALVRRWPGTRVTGLEVDARQHAKNLASPEPGIEFLAGGAEALPFEDGRFDLVLMLKSLHHVPRPLMAQALAEAARVLRPGGHLYVSEPVYGGAFNELIRLFNDEGVVRAAAQAAVDLALREGPWQALVERRFEMPAHFASFEDFEMRQMRPSFADHRIDDAKLARVRAAYQPHAAADGSADFLRPMHVRLLRRLPG